MDDRLTPQLDEVIEAALRSHPVAPMPRTITANVMSRIRRTQAPRFRFTPEDAILAIVLTMVISAIIFSLQSLPGHVILQFRIQSILFWQSLLVNARWMVPALFFGLAALLASLALPTLFRMSINHKG